MILATTGLDDKTTWKGSKRMLTGKPEVVCDDATGTRPVPFDAAGPAGR